MTSLSDGTLDHLRQVADWPDLSETRYEIVEPIARGGMGTVYLANDRHLRRPVALKVLHAPTPGPEAGERMLREARIIARLEHPGIVPVHDVGTLPDGRIFYAMKQVAGERLDRRLRAGLPLSERLRLFERICEAVAFAHAHGVVHRDLKPENVMVGAFGEVLVLDWGLAKLRSDSAPGPAGPSSAPDGAGLPGQTGHGTVLGTPGYMAPEQARGDVAGIDERTDVYSLGAILYFLLVGRTPGPHPSLPGPHRDLASRPGGGDPAHRAPAASRPRPTAAARGHLPEGPGRGPRGPVPDRIRTRGRHRSLPGPGSGPGLSGRLAGAGRARLQDASDGRPPGPSLSRDADPAARVCAGLTPRPAPASSAPPPARPRAWRRATPPAAPGSGPSRRPGASS